MEKSKRCNKCKEIKTMDSFSKDSSKRDGKRTICKACTAIQSSIYAKKNSQKLRAYYKENYQRNRESILAQKKQYYIKNKDEITEKKKHRYQRDRKKNIDRQKQYYQENKEAILKYNLNYANKRRKEDPAYALECRLRTAMNSALRKSKTSKSSSTIGALGCTAELFKQHIERQFLKGMTWENRDQWHLDHITPISTAMTEDDIYALSHFTNIRPMWAIDNMSKGAKIQYII